MSATMLAVATAVAVVLPAAPAVAVDRWDVPRNATITITGRGYGHGKGLSQYGAQGAARKGLGYRRIIGFYYPKSQWGKAGGTLRVLITDKGKDVVVKAARGLTVRRLGDGRTWRLDKAKPKASRWRIKPDGDRSVISYRTGGWHRWKSVASTAEFRGDGPLTLVRKSGRARYRGALRSVGPHTVNVVRLEDYLRGVVPQEVPALWKPAAVQAQAVAARTYAAFERKAAPRSRGYDLCDTSHCQVYGGVGAEHPASDRAIRATRNVVRTRGGSPIFAQFSASNGGRTVAGGYPYLPAKKDPYDRWSGNPYRSWTVRLTDRDLEAQWPGIGDLEAIRVGDRTGGGTWGGRPSTVTLRGADGSTTRTGDDVRTRFGLRSTWFTFSVSRR